MTCQQDELYAAEMGGFRGRVFNSLPEILEYVTALRDLPYYQEYFPMVVHTEVYGHEGGGSVGAYQDGVGVIEMDRCHWNEQFVLHELAHVLAAARYGSHAHDPWFARTYLELVYHVQGSEAYARLYSAFEYGDIDHTI